MLYSCMCDRFVQKSEHYGNGDMEADDSDDGANRRPAPPVVQDSSKLALETSSGQVRSSDSMDW